jgi:hypothetical protein
MIVPAVLPVTFTSVNYRNNPRRQFIFLNKARTFI